MKYMAKSAWTLYPCHLLNSSRTVHTEKFSDLAYNEVRLWNISYVKWKGSIEEQQLSHKLVDYTDSQSTKNAYNVLHHLLQNFLLPLEATLTQTTHRELDIFSEGMKPWQHGGWIMVCQKPRERYLFEYIVPTVKFDGGGMIDLGLFLRVWTRF